MPLRNLVAREHAEVAGQPYTCAERDEPLCRIVLVPPHRVAVVHWELVVEVVVALTHREERREQVIPRRLSIVVRRIAKPMSDGVNTEGALQTWKDSGRDIISEEESGLTW